MQTFNPVLRSFSKFQSLNSEGVNSLLLGRGLWAGTWTVTRGLETIVQNRALEMHLSVNPTARPLPPSHLELLMTEVSLRSCSSECRVWEKSARSHREGGIALGLDRELSFLAEKERWSLLSRDSAISKRQRRKGSGPCYPEFGRHPCDRAQSPG